MERGEHPNLLALLKLIVRKNIQRTKFNKSRIRLVIKYKNGKLNIENVGIHEIASEIGTPFYCYSYDKILDQYRKLADALSKSNVSIYFAVKANSNLSIIRTLANEGAGADVVSVGELKRCLLADLDPKKIVFSGVGKTSEEIAEALKQDIFQINVESEAELITINEVAESLGKVANIGLRVNPDVDAKTHEKITTGMKENKFGVDLKDAPIFFSKASALSNISLKSLAVHIGSQLTELSPYRKAYGKVAEMTLHLRTSGYDIHHLDLGGGLGIPYSDESSADLYSFNEIITDTVGGLDCKLSVEPGRYLVGEAGILVTRVIYIKQGEQKKFVIVDAAMNDLIRPTLYDGFHDIIPVSEETNTSSKSLTDLVGPICESGDYLAQDRMLPDVSQNDLLAIKCAGAYGAAMASNYNSRPLIPEVFVRDNAFSVVRERQSFEEMIQKEKLADWLL